MPRTEQRKLTMHGKCGRRLLDGKWLNVLRSRSDQKVIGRNMYNCWLHSLLWTVKVKKPRECNFSYITILNEYHAENEARRKQSTKSSRSPSLVSQPVWCDTAIGILEDEVHCNPEERLHMQQFGNLLQVRIYDSICEVIKFKFSILRCLMF